MLQVCSILATRNPELRGPYMEDTIITRALMERIIPWVDGFIIKPNPFTYNNTHGYRQYYNTFYLPMDIRVNAGNYKLINYIDGYTYYKVGAGNHLDIVSFPDGIIGPMDEGVIYCGDEPLSIISNVAGHEFKTSRGTLTNTINNPRGPSAGVFLVPEDAPSKNILIHRKYARQYDLQDFEIGWPVNPIEANTSFGGAGTSPYHFTSTGASTQNTFNRIDGAGASSIQAGIRIPTVTTGSGIEVNLSLERQDDTGVAAVFSSLDFPLATGTYLIPTPSGNLDADMDLSIHVAGTCDFLIDQMFATIGFG